MHIDELTAIVIEKSILIHSKYGPGCFEKVYEELLCYELIKEGIFVERQVLLPITHEDLYIANAYKVDLIADRRLIIELKSVHPLPPVFFKQIRTQLSLLNMKYGLLLNFKVALMKEGINRVFNNFGTEFLISPST